ncbi:MAG: hypothetical protein LBF51_10665, partial [Zoogloeaceae bacterium]|nr:hypothetical protein [Zoogloeaceae bacterium]
MKPVSTPRQAAVRRFSLTPVACAVALAFVSPAIGQTLDIAQVPLFAGSSSSANLLYIHDDSGSM